MLLLDVDEVVQSHGLALAGQRDEQEARDGLEGGVHAVLHDVVDSEHELLELPQLAPDGIDVVGDVHAGPGEGHASGPQLELQIVQVRLQQIGGDGFYRLHDAAVLPEDEGKLVVVPLELTLLQQHHLRGLRNLDVHAREALGLADQLEDLPVEVHVQFAVVRVAHDQSGAQTGLRLLDGVHPRLVPEGLELDQSFRHLVVHADNFFRVLAGQDGRAALELLHGTLDAAQQVTGPRDVSRDGGEVPHQGGRRFVLLVLVLDGGELQPVVVENDRELGLQVRAQRLPLEDALELLQQVQGAGDARDRLEALVDELLQGRLEVGDAHVEVDVVAVEAVVVEVQQVVALVAKVLHDVLKVVHEHLHAVEPVLAQRLELVDGGEHVDQFHHAAAEEVELPEDQRFRKIKLLPLRKG
mmetsp:Transcript_26221/g.66047  ORF Transcript_26221/g.66047 Transcript_26221/m.66047 type:complete len:412 (+) Transcript_26221:7324-8559(+)